MILIYDTETSGLWRDTLPATDPSQPHLVQLAAELLSEDYERQALLVGLVKPDGWTIEPQAQDVHRISTIQATRYGVPLAALVSVFYQLALKATRIVAHNVEFDRHVMTAALFRAAGEVPLDWRKKMNAFYCTQENAAPYCALEGPIPGIPKFPSLEEAHARLVPEVAFHSRHDALDDLLATKRVFMRLMEREKNGNANS